MKSLIDFITGSRACRYWLWKLSNSPAFDPVFDLLAERVRVGFQRLKSMGLAPDTVVDIGANEGQWSRMILPVFPNARFVMVEAQPAMVPHLERVAIEASGRARVVSAMLGPEKAAEVSFFLAGTGSSRFEEVTSFARERIALPMTTLDDVLEDNGDARLFLKLDVQGGELDVLAGAQRSLQTTDAILLEASIVEYNAGAPRFSQVISTMDELGFLLFDIWDLRRIGLVLAQCDLVFVRKRGAFENRAQAVVRQYGADSKSK